MNRTPRKTPAVVETSPSRTTHPTLAEYVRQTRHQKNLSLADVSARSGGQIGTTHVSRIENRLVSNVSLRRLRALARGLGVPEDEVVAVARGKFPRSESEAMGKQLLDYFNELPEDAQLYVLHMMRGLLEGISKDVLS
jgi:transcriptional regulator with XRE-family HTH domain